MEVEEMATSDAESYARELRAFLAAERPLWALPHPLAAELKIPMRVFRERLEPLSAEPLMDGHASRRRLRQQWFSELQPLMAKLDTECRLRAGEAWLSRPAVGRVSLRAAVLCGVRGCRLRYLIKLKDDFPPSDSDRAVVKLIAKSDGLRDHRLMDVDPPASEVPLKTEAEEEELTLSMPEPPPAPPAPTPPESELRVADYSPSEPEETFSLSSFTPTTSTPQRAQPPSFRPPSRLAPTTPRTTPYRVLNYTGGRLLVSHGTPNVRVLSQGTPGRPRARILRAIRVPQPSPPTSALASPAPNSFEGTLPKPEEPPKLPVPFRLSDEETQVEVLRLARRRGLIFTANRISVRLTVAAATVVRFITLTEAEDPFKVCVEESWGSNAADTKTRREYWAKTPLPQFLFTLIGKLDS